MAYLNIIFFAVFTILSLPFFSRRINSMLAAGPGESDVVGLFPADKRHYRLIVILLLSVAAAVRIYQFGAIPAGFNIDEAMATVEANALAKYGTDHYGMKLPVYFTAWGYGQMSVLQSYLMIPFIRLFGPSVFTARLPMLLINLTAVYVFYRFMKYIGNTTALAALFILAINPWHIMLSRWALESNLYPAFLLFSLCALRKGLQKPVFLYLSMFFFAISMYAYGIAFFATPLLMLAIAVYLVGKKMINVRRLALCAFVYFFFAWPIFGVMVVNYFRLGDIATPLFTIPYFPDQIRTGDLLLKSPNKPIQAVRNIYSLFRTAIFQFPDAIFSSLPTFGPLYLFSMPLIVAGGYRLIKTRGTLPAVILLFWLAVGVFTGVMVRDANINRVNIIFFPLTALCGIGFHGIVFANSGCSDRMGGRFLRLMPVAMYVIAFALFVNAYFGRYRDILVFNNGFGQAVEYAESKDKPVLYITSDARHRNPFQVSEILTLFHARTDAHYYQGISGGSGPNGPYELPYGDRYRYIIFSENEEILLDADALYIFTVGEAHLFPDGQFEVIRFGDYCVGMAVP